MTRTYPFRLYEKLAVVVLAVVVLAGSVRRAPPPPSQPDAWQVCLGIVFFEWCWERPAKPKTLAPDTPGCDYVGPCQESQPARRPHYKTTTEPV